MSDFCAEGAVVHEKDVKVLDISDCELLEAIRKIVSGFIVRSITNLGHFLVASESSSHSVVDTYMVLTVP